MKVLASVVALATVAGRTNAFAPSHSLARSPISLRSNVEECPTEACEVPSDFAEAPSLVGVPNGANAIRSAVVTNAAGDFVRVEDVIRSSKVNDNGPHIVIYLRHMG